jgi:hypothetical protein
MTPRQHECLALRDQGLAVKVIAKQLGLSPNTVKDAITGARNALRREGKLPPAPEMPSGRNYAQNERKILGLLGHTPMGSRALLAAMPEISQRQAHRHINRLAKEGKIVKKGSGVSLVWMTPALAKAIEMRDAAALRQLAAETEAAKARQAVRRKAEAKAIRTIPTVETRPSVASVQVHAGKHQYPIDASKAKIQYIPTPRGRYECDHPPKPGMFSQDWMARRMA